MSAATPTLRQAECLVGIRYVPKQFTCMHLVHLTQRQLFGRDTAPALHHRHPVRGAAQARMFDQLKAELADPVDVPVSGDVALFHAPWREWQWHAGTVLVQGGERWLLHTHAAIGESVLQRMRDCALQGLKLEGFYRLKPASGGAA